MALKRPEGLSPCYLSLVSPDISESLTFSWAFRGVDTNDYQTKFTIDIYDINGGLLKSYTKSTRQMYCSINEVGYSFQVGTRYMWTVKTYNKDGWISDSSVFAAFYYDTCPAVTPITWSYIPKPGEVITSNTYFKEMKDNIVTILSEYGDDTITLRNRVSTLFTGSVVPSRDDFKTLEAVIDYLSLILEYTKSIDVDGPVEDSLGVTDLEKIRNHIDLLTTIPPKPVIEMEIQTNIPPMYKVTSLSAVSNGVEDTTIDLSWAAESIQSQTGKFIFTTLSPSKDVRYYTLVFEYGPSSSPYVCELFYKADELSNGSSRDFDMNWDGLYDTTNIGTARHTVRVKAVDHRGNISATLTRTKTYGNDLKVPLGIKYYDIQYYKGSLSDIGYNVNGTWLAVGQPTGKSITHSIAGGEGKFFYRVQAVDMSGLKSDWTYSNGITFDPLKPPSAPQNLHVTGVAVDALSIAWNAVPTAESYEIDRWTDRGWGWIEGVNLADGLTSPSYWNGSLEANTTYGYFVRAWNRAGVSDWAGVAGRTDRQTHVGYWDSVHAHSWRDDSEGWYPDQGVGHTYIYQGRYGTSGNNRGSWYFSYENMRQVLSGAEILSARISIQRSGVGGNNTAYTPMLYLHDRTTDDWAKNHSGLPTVLGWGHDPGVAFSKGERKWVSVPKEYIESIRDGGATGIMLYTPDGSRYMRFETWAQIEVTYKK